MCDCSIRVTAICESAAVALRCDCMLSTLQRGCYRCFVWFLHVFSELRVKIQVTYDINAATSPLVTAVLGKPTSVPLWSNIMTARCAF